VKQFKKIMIEEIIEKNTNKETIPPRKAFEGEEDYSSPEKGRVKKENPENTGQEKPVDRSHDRRVVETMREEREEREENIKKREEKEIKKDNEEGLKEITEKAIEDFEKILKKEISEKQKEELWEKSSDLKNNISILEKNILTLKDSDQKEAEVSKLEKIISGIEEKLIKPLEEAKIITVKKRFIFHEKKIKLNDGTEMEREDLRKIIGYALKTIFPESETEESRLDKKVGDFFKW